MTKFGVQILQIIMERGPWSIGLMGQPHPSWVGG